MPIETAVLALQATPGQYIADPSGNHPQRLPGLAVKTKCPVGFPLPTLRPGFPADVDNASVGTKATGSDPDLGPKEIPTAYSNSPSRRRPEDDRECP